MRDRAGMATLSEKIAAEQAIRKLLDNDGLPQPDEVEYGHTCIRLFWHDTKQMVVIQIDEPPPGFVYAEDMTDEERESALAAAPEPDESEMPFQRYRPGQN
jgi:hypothetical protein